MKKIQAADFKITKDTPLDIQASHYDLESSKKTVEKELKKLSKQLGKLQNTLYAHGKYAVLVCFQGMDTAGKDSLIREVFKNFNVRGVVVHSFKVPTEEELKHDYLWRHYIALPERGRFAVFNRTHYENVLVTRVHPEYILGEKIPTIQGLSDINDTFWEQRFKQINAFEKHISENGTIIFKFFLNLSKEEQRRRLLRRLNKKEKTWKFSPSDLKERKLWESYETCYTEAINKTSKSHAPWYNIPADDKPTARYLVAKIMSEILNQYTDIKYPEPSAEIEENITMYKEQLNRE